MTTRPGRFLAMLVPVAAQLGLSAVLVEAQPLGHDDQPSRELAPPVGGPGA
jgi:hypothetical protein